MARRNWSREETILAFRLFCEIPFKKVNSKHEKIIELSKLIDRTPSAIGMKIGNFGRLDPELKKKNIVGLKNGSKLEEVLWNEFNNNWSSLYDESEKILNKRKQTHVKQETSQYDGFPAGEEKKSFTKHRKNQAFFRKIILASYNSTCCITGIKIPNLLIASHIKPWRIADDKNEKLNPQNGLCLNVLHDKAFDIGLITIMPDFKIKVSDKLSLYKENKSLYHNLIEIDNKKIHKPEKFLPKKEFLEYHNQNIFNK